MNNKYIYIIVKESGEYELFTKTNIAYYKTYEEAEAFINLHENLNKINGSLQNYYIEQIEHGNSVKNTDKLLAKARAAHEHMIQKEEEADNLRLDRIKSILDDATICDMNKVYDFLLWWEGGINKDRYFYEKISARGRSISAPMKRYMEAVDDPKVADWVSCHKHLISIE